MTKLLMVKERIKLFIEKNDKFARPVIKFILALVLLIIINTYLPYFPIVNSIFVSVGLALICAFLDLKFMTVFAGLVLILDTYQISLEMAIVEAVLFIIVFVFYFRFSKGEAYALLLLPLAYVLHIPFVIPIAIGIVGSMGTMIPVIFGTVLCYFTQFVNANAATLTKASSLSILERFQFIAQRILAQSQLLVIIVSVVATIITVNLIKKLSINYAWTVAVLAGALVNAAVVIVGTVLFNTGEDIVSIVVGEIVSLIIGLLVQFFYFTVDYSRVEKVQFEDDEYYYYVKAVPKLSVTAPEITIKRFSKIQPVAEDVNLKDVNLEDIVSQGLEEIDSDGDNQ